jgi:MoaA/NifB/PqqE/SkfB family radical SAM enzyme
MKYIIYGINRVAKDFLYIFEDLEIFCLTEDAAETKEIWGYPVQSIEEALENTSYNQIILCGFDNAQKEEKLQKQGLIYGRDYVYERDFFPRLDELSIPKDRRILVWGTGMTCRFFLEQELPFTVDAFVDSYKNNCRFMGKEVLSPEEITDWKSCYVIAAVERAGEIFKELSAYGLTEGEDFTGYQSVLYLPSRMLEKTVFDPSCYDLECNTMENHLEILDYGNTRCCCTTFVKPNLGNVFEKSSSEIWNSILHKILCLSTENKTFSFCDKTMCPLFVAKKSEAEKTKSMKRVYKKMKPAPEVLALGYDASCNLSCSTCRKELHFAKGEELETVNRITELVEQEYLPQCRFLILAGNGEVFASPAYRRIYESEKCRPDYIRLLSNGMLFNKTNWERLQKRHKGQKIMLTVSIDAASKKTYESIRRNGNFDILKKNMEFASELRKAGELSYFRMNFVVQRENYQEMIPFVEWGKELGTDEIFFTKILNWGTYTEEEFAGISMMEEDGITPKPELKEVLEHPVMKSRIVDLGTIQYAHKADAADVVENYYMWELEKRGGALFV